MKFVLLHEAKNDEGIRAFFMDVWELYVKVCVFIPVHCAISAEVYLRISRTSLSAVYLLPCMAEIRQSALACLGTGTTNTNAFCDRQR